jgi:two-component system, NarL family, response regulator
LAIVIERTAEPMSTSAPIRILVADDHPLLREGIAALIAEHSGLHLVGEAASGREAVERFRALQPDVTLMDLQMPGMGGIEAIEIIRREFPAARIIVLTTYAGDVLAQRALRAGAQAYVLKGLVRKDLLEVIQAVHGGLKHIQADIAMQLAAHIGGAPLTSREVEVLTLIGSGNSNKRIGLVLSINEDTVKGHVKSILSKLEARDRTHAVTLALRRGILQL